MRRAERVHRRLTLAALALAGLWLTGCWDRVEVNDIAIVTATAVDGEPGEVRLAVHVADPAGIQGGSAAGGGRSGRAPVLLVTGRGRTVAAARDEIQTRMARRLFWSHNPILLLGERRARAGVRPVLDFFNRFEESRLGQTFLAVTRGPARRVMEVPATLEAVPGVKVREQQALRIGPAVSLREAIMILTREGQELLLVAVAARPLNDAPGGAGPGGAPAEPTMTGAAVFRGDRLAGFLNQDQVRAVMRLNDQQVRSAFTVELRSGGALSARLKQTTARLTPLPDRDPAFTARITGTANVIEDRIGLDFTHRPTRRVVEQALAAWVEAETEAVIATVQQRFGADVFGFGMRLRRARPRLWEALREQWPRHFASLPVRVSARVRVAQTGLLARPVGSPSRRLPLDAGE